MRTRRHRKADERRVAGSKKRYLSDANEQNAVDMAERFRGQNPHERNYGERLRDGFRRLSDGDE